MSTSNIDGKDCILENNESKNLFFIFDTFDGVNLVTGSLEKCYHIKRIGGLQFKYILHSELTKNYKVVYSDTVDYKNIVIKTGYDFLWYFKGIPLDRFK